MSDYFIEHLKSSPKILNLSVPDGKEPDPFKRIENYFKKLIDTWIRPAYDENKRLLLHIYCTGHGYMGKNGASQLLLNAPIAIGNDENSFLNPYPI